MKKIIQLTVLIFSSLVILFACQQENQLLDSEKEIKEVIIYKSNKFKKEKSELIVTATDTEHPEIVEAVKSMLVDASKQDGVVDTIEPNYYLEIIYQDNRTKELYLWLMDVEGGKGSFMKVEETHIIYNFSKELKTQLIHLIESTTD